MFVGSIGTTGLTSRTADPLPGSRPVAAGAAHSLAIDASGAVWSWGDNLAGQLGTGDHLARVIPTRVSGLTGTFVAVSAGAGHSLALRNDGKVFAWGVNLEGQLGIGNNVNKAAPVQIATLTNIVSVAAGGGHSLAVKADGSLWAWGGNTFGQLGDGTTAERRAPVRVAALSGVVAVEAGLAHSLALRADGTAWSWGGNTGGQLGIGTLTLQRRPVRVLNVTNATQIAAGALHSLAVTHAGTVWGWGLNRSGAVGDGSTTTRTTPVALSGVPVMAKIAAGGAHSIAITASGRTFAWGDNIAGQLGDGSTTRRLVPASVLQPPANVVAIAAGGAHTIALAGDGAVWTWGNNLLAQLGDGTRTARRAPSPISGPDTTWGAHPPLFSPAGGTFPGQVSVSLATPTPNAVIRYTIGGADPTASDPLFTSPIAIAVSTTIKARAFRSGMTPSAVSAATYTIGGGTLAAPVATPPGGTYAQAQAVTVTADAGAAIRYTVDGSDPTQSSSLFTAPITIAGSTTLRARAFKIGFTASEILTATYLIVPTVPPGEDPPPDPQTVAPPLSDVSLTGYADAYAFLFAGADPIQREHTPGSIAAHRFSIIRGRVLDRAGAPLAGVRVTPKDQPGVGHTVTREDGAFDLAVNGGGPLTLDYTRDGFLPAERSVDAPWEDFASAPDVRLIQLDPVATNVSFEPRTVSTVARGSVSNDDSGARQATIVVPETGVMAIIRLPDGTVMPGVSRLTMRATEYTVGDGGPASMPAALPATSGYTYAVELTADEALAAGAASVTFDPPLALYVENFLHFPVGGAAPAGYYDRAQSKWIPSNDGRVIAILGVNAGGETELDIDGSGLAADADALAALGVTSGERKRLALLYSSGQSLWRTPIPHFSTYDINWPFGPALDAEAPGLGGAGGGPDGVSPTGPESPGTRNLQAAGLGLGADGKLENGCEGSGSIIECQNQTLGELIAISGTPFSLSYRSDRVPGYSAVRTMSIPLTRSSVPASLKRVELSVSVAGQKHQFDYSPAPGQSTSFTWNGLDAYGRARIGQQPATATVSHVYDGVYYSVSNFQKNFALPPPISAPVIGDPLRREISVQEELTYVVEARRASQAPVAGWYVSDHHRYDARTGVLFMGDGAQRNASAAGDVIETMAGGGETPVAAGETVPGREALFEFPGSIAATADGTVYFNDNAGILVLSAGVLTRVVTFSNDGAGVPGSGRVAARGDLAVYAYGDTNGDCAEGGSFSTLHVRRLTPEGLADELASVPTVPSSPPSCAGGMIVAFGSDGTLFLAVGFEAWAIPPGGAGVRIGTFTSPVSALATGPGGSVYIAAVPYVRQWRPDGTLRLLAGNGAFGNDGDGGLAVNASLGSVTAMVTDADGNIVIASHGDADARLRVIRPNGTIEWYAGIDSANGSTSNGSPGRRAWLGFVAGLSLTPDGSLYLTSSSDAALVRRLRLQLNATRVPAGDGSSVYEFDVSGRHLRTVDALTGVALLTFSYDTAGLLVAIADRDGLETRINRDGTGRPSTIVSPFGVTTTLSVGAPGFLDSVTDAEGGVTSLGYRDGGLLVSLTDANQNEYTFDYTPGGRLLRDANAAGGLQELSRSRSGNGWMVTHDIADAGTRTYITEQGSNGTQSRRVRSPDGTETVSLNRGDGSTVTTTPDGTVTTSTLTPDPRFGFSAPIAAATTVRTPAGLTMTVAKSRSVTLADPNNPLSVVTQTDTTTVNGRVSRSLFDGVTRTITSTSPLNRRVVTALNASGRPSSVQVGTLLPTLFVYDEAGRLASQTQGDRTTSFAYDASGYLASVTDPLNRTVQFANDLLGRRTTQTFADLRVARFGYDAGGNLTSLTPPGRPAHTMRYTAADLLDTYTAPPAPDAAVTQYAFNRAKQPAAVLRADGQSITWTYDGAGRPATLTTPTGDTTYAYDAATGQLATVASPAGGLSYSYDGALQIGETASGVTTGAVTWNYDT
ncbi:MAG: chitobiase/beta-hexosaminidase C-terminal domain-containing protein, partial [Cyanobacteria bacterium]|nr:chitobiase/beta-hexosaminidase C-terminal domain-containing protein [Cyanobacteriota bacterium]